MHADQNGLPVRSRQFDGTGAHDLVERGLGRPIAVPAPSLLSEMLPTLAESAMTTDRPERGRSGRTCLSTSAGPMVLTANACASACALICLFAFSGAMPLLCRKPVAMTTSRSAPWPATTSMADAIEASFVISIAGLPERERPVTRS